MLAALLHDAESALEAREGGTGLDPLVLVWWERGRLATTPSLLFAVIFNRPAAAAASGLALTLPVSNNGSRYNVQYLNTHFSRSVSHMAQSKILDPPRFDANGWLS
ncbi:hypothetical protein BaRGS_00017396 [Batillaria attramentaria]|uniref:Uncharacterized protein n=1 Tax=Batillaria attramentaria TaxID=370345 RepID=A0ABD0KW22_9CAEN